MVSRRNLLAGLLMSAALNPLRARARPDMTPITLPLFHTAQPAHRLDDRLVTVDGLTYRLFRAFPKGAAPAQGWPVLWLMDGNAMFDRLPGDLLAAHPGLVIIGVGYDTDRPFSGAERARDYTPPPVRPDPRNPQRQIGGAAAFLSRLTGALRDAGETGLPVDPARRTLGGHSYAGLFTLYARSQPGTGFSRFVAISPALWLDPIRPEGDGPVLVMVGDREREQGQGGELEDPSFEVPRPTRDFVAAARAAGQAVELVILPGLDHGTTVAGALPDAVGFADAKRPPE